jgi:hypothetical protein
MTAPSHAELLRRLDHQERTIADLRAELAGARMEALVNQYKADRCAAAAHHWHHQYVGALAAADQAQAALREATAE